ncbi:hypothetical protein EK904_006158 [Melospiza melodia maxima]|nr:hypothetical protein EK904_006158 [Melospiza melodia maxima]
MSLRRPSTIHFGGTNIFTYENVNVLGDYREMTKSKYSLLNVVSIDTSLETKCPKPQNTSPKKPHPSGMLSAETPRREGTGLKVPKFTPLSTHSLFLSGSSKAKGLPEALGEEELQGGDRNATATAQPGLLGSLRDC